jgi:argininosuccinate lyase
LPTGYNRDLQEDKPPLWGAFDVVQSCLGILPGLLETLDFNTDRLELLANANFATATELANFLVSEQGLPFRKCHEIVGSVVGGLAKTGKTFRDWEETQKLLRSEDIDLSVQQLQRILDPKLSLRNNRSLGGTSSAEVKRMVGEFEEKLNGIDSQIRSRQEQINDAYQKTLRVIEQVLGDKAIAEVNF